MTDTTVKYVKVHRVGSRAFRLRVGPIALAVPASFMSMLSISFPRPQVAANVSAEGHEDAEFSLYNADKQEIAWFSFGKKHLIYTGNNYARAPVGPSIENTIFRDCCFDQTVWTHTHLESVRFERCSFEQVQWNRVTARDVDFADSEGKIVREGSFFDRTVNFRHIKAI